MNPRQLITGLDSFIDLPFNLCLCLILAVTCFLAIRSPRLLLLLVGTSTAAILTFDRSSTLGETIKTICLFPLGLGSILLFLSLDRSLQTKYFAGFTRYVNIAVYGNIGMMLGTPPGGTLRGICTKFACFALFVWVIRQGSQANWKTILLHDKIFLFASVSKPWVFAHAVYRFILLTLPCFGTGRRHRLLEMYSLTLTYALSRKLGLPFEQCFGMADTLVVPVEAAWSSAATAFALITPDSKGIQPFSDYIGREMDVLLGVAALAVAGFACLMIFAEADGKRGTALKKRIDG